MRPVSSRAVLLISMLVVFTFLMPSPKTYGQAIPQFSSVEPHEYDTINLGTLAIQLNVPIRTKAGHIPYSYRLNGASQISVVLFAHSSPALVASSWLIGGEAHVPRTFSITSSSPCSGGVLWKAFAVTDAAGNSHSFNFQVGSLACGGSQENGAYASDNSGLYLDIKWNNGNPISTLYDISGNWSTVPFQAMTDPNGNTISKTTDTLGQTAITLGTGTYTWTDALNNPQSVTVSGSGSSYKTHVAFGCPYDSPASSGSSPVTTSFSFPDSSTMSFTEEMGQYDPTAFTGRIASVTLPTGGTISYSYSGGTNGINCVDGTPATVTRTTPDGQWVYTHDATANTTTVKDPQGNYTVYSFIYAFLGPDAIKMGPMETEKQVYNGQVAPANLVQTVITCWNNTNSTPTNCGNFSGGTQMITEKDVYTTYPGVTGYSAVKTAYDSFGRVSKVQTYDFNVTTPAKIMTIVYGTGSPSSQTCGAISSIAPGKYIIDKPCSVTLTDGSGNVLSQTWNSYDSNGNLLQTWNLVSGSGSSGTYLSKQYTYDAHGVVQTMTDVNGQVMNYTTTSCNNMFVTSQYPTTFSNLQTSQTWDCNGGVVTSATDANGQTTQTLFFVNSLTDPFYRPVEGKDQLLNITSYTYTPTSTESVFLFNSNNSVIDTLSTTDSIGRPVVSQLRQGPSNSNWDTKSRSFDSDGRPYQTSLACVTTAGTACPASTESQTYDALNRPRVHTDTGSPAGVVTKTYYANDVLSTLTPAPSGEHAKSVQKEFDGLGRLKSTCLISSATGSGPCGQANGGTGFLTTYTYDGAGRLLQSVENAQVSSPRQTRSYTYDLMGRVLTEANPESGTVHYTYDSVTGTNCTVTSKGDLVQTVDANGNTICHHYDGLHRETSTTYAGPNSNNGSKYFVYDSATVNGTAMSYAEGHMAEAYTTGVMPFQNTDFEASSNLPPSGWTASSATLSYDTTTQYAGARSLKTAATMLYGGAYSSYQPGFPGKTYAISGYIKSDGTCLAYIQIRFLDSTGAYLDSAQTAVSAQTSWHLVTATNVAPANTAYTQLGLPNANSTGAGICEFDNIMATGLVIDEGFSYDKRSQLSDYYQLSPNSGGYYHLSATYWEDKGLKTVSGVGLPTLYYGASDGTGLDGEGRVTKVNASAGTNPVSGITYVTSGTTQPIGSLQKVTLGTADFQSFTYDVNTTRMTQYSASVGATPTVISGTLTWNPNGTLQQLNISDGYNSTDTQICSYLYDDFIRVAGVVNGTPGVNCVNGSTKIWNQTFTYGTDGFGNLTKSTSGPGLAWNPGYNSANNQYTLGGTIYDSNGNLLNDTFHSYTWLPDGHVASVVTGSTTASVTYDAMGNKVEENIGGTIHEYLSAFGVSAQMTGQTENATNVDLPGGVQALFSGGALQRFRFPDWQGTIRAESNPSTRAFTESLAFAPFGERYALKGAPFNVDSFTGKPDQLVSDEYDFEARELHNGQGRWVSPDPMRGSGNKYAYADNNPLSKLDPYGLWVYQPPMDPTFQAWFDSEMNRPDPLLESHAPWSGQTGAEAFDVSENAYLASVDSAFESDVSLETPPVLQREQAAQEQHEGQPAQQAQNSTTGRQSDGSYVADLKSTEIAPLLDPNHKPSNSDVVGPNGECVDLTKKFSGMGKDDVGTYQWRPGPKVVDSKDIRPGTAIATFNDKDRYPSKHGWNSGIYLNSGVKGSIWILDQWPGYSPRPREVFLDNNRDRPDNSAAYSVIYVVPR
jgi:RHS repeat-associated protein